MSINEKQPWIVYSDGNNSWEYALVSHVITSSRNASMQGEVVMPVLNVGKMASGKEEGGNALHKPFRSQSVTYR